MLCGAVLAGTTLASEAHNLHVRTPISFRFHPQSSSPWDYHQ